MATSREGEAGAEVTVQPRKRPALTPTLGSLCTGYGGLEIAVESVLGTTTAWCSEVEPYACSVIARRLAGVPNLGDLKVIDWSEVEPIDVLTAGYPCQPFSTAGQRKGTDDPRHLWPYVADAIRALRPGLVVLENVRGHLSLGFDHVLRDLADLGFDAEWVVVRASDVGACHRRERLFVVCADPGRERWWDGAGIVGGLGVEGLVARSDDADTAVEGRRWPGSEPPEVPARSGSGSRAQPGRHGARDRVGVPPDADSDHADGCAGAWGDFGPAIERHAAVLGRPAPSPVDELGRLSHHFVEWMQMLPEGHVTRVEHMKRNPALRLLGNGVVPPQAAYAITHLLEREPVAA